MEYKVDLWDDEADFHAQNVHALLQCLGCDSVTYRKLSSDSETYDFDGYAEWAEFFPEANKIETMADSEYLPNRVSNIYDETIKAISAGQNILAAIGIRTLIEAVCTEKDTRGDNLHGKILDLKEKGVVTEGESEILIKIKNIGNKAAHNTVKHTKSQLSVALDVVEHMLASTYIIPEKAEKAFRERGVRRAPENG